MLPVLVVTWCTKCFGLLTGAVSPSANYSHRFILPSHCRAAVPGWETCKVLPRKPCFLLLVFVKASLWLLCRQMHFSSSLNFLLAPGFPCLRTSSTAFNLNSAMQLFRVPVVLNVNEQILQKSQTACRAWVNSRYG